MQTMQIRGMPSARPSINLDDGDSSPGIGREDTLTLMTARSMKSGRLTHRSSTWKSGQSVVSREDKRKVLVKDFLETNGFMHVNEAKRSWGMTSYPLHAAVHQKNAAVVKALLQLGARPDVKYRGQTPEEYAQRKNQRWGGYEEVLSIFEVVIPKTTGSHEDGEASSENSTVLPDDD